MAYDAFISYSHSADGQLAPALQTALHKFAKPWWKMRAVNVFRDGTSLAAAHDLSEAITTALAASRFFIFLAAPRAAQSKWCTREVEYWIKERPPETLLIVLTEGTILWDEATRDFDWTVTDAVPRALSGVFASEPLWIDLSWAKNGEQVSRQDPRFQQSVAMLAARLHGKSLDEIAGEDVRQHRRTRLLSRAAVAGMVGLTLSSLAGAWFALEGQRRAVRNLDHALGATDTLVDEVADGIRNFYGVPREKLAGILDKVEGILTTLATLEDSPAILMRRISMMTTLSRANFELGNLKRAEELANTVVELAEPLAHKEGPGSRAWHRLAAIQEDLCDIARRRSDYAKTAVFAKRYLELSDAMFTGLTPKTPGNIRHAAFQYRALARERLSKVANDRGFTDQALAWAREMVAASELYLKEYPNEVSAQKLASSQRAQLAELLSDLGRPDEAMAGLDTARAELIRLDEANHNRLDILRVLVGIERTRATIFETRDDWRSAALAYENAATVLGRLFAADTKNVSMMSQLGATRHEFANALSRNGDKKRARAELALAKEHYRAVLVSQPDNLQVVRGVVNALKLEATFLEEDEDRVAALERLDEAAELSLGLLRQRGVDDGGLLMVVNLRVDRARLHNLRGLTASAIDDLDFAERKLGEIGRPAAPADLATAAAAVVGVARQWGYAGNLERSLKVVNAALSIYTPPQGVSDAALVGYRTSMTGLHLQKAVAQLDRGDLADAIATMEASVRSFESDILPVTQRDTAVDRYAQHVLQYARIANVAGDKIRAMELMCGLSGRLGALMPMLDRKPRLRLTALYSDLQCAQDRFFGGRANFDETEKLVLALEQRLEGTFASDTKLMREWFSTRANIAQLRAALRHIAKDLTGAIPLFRTAIRYYEDASRGPQPATTDVSAAAFLHGQLGEILDEIGDTAAGRVEMEVSIKTWRRAASLDRIDYQLEIGEAKAMIELASMWVKEDAEKAFRLTSDAAALLTKVLARVPATGRRLVLPPLVLAHYRAGDAAYDLKQHDVSVARQRRALEVSQSYLVLASDDAERHLDLGRQYARLARALLGAKIHAEAREATAKARAVFLAYKDRAEDPAAIERLIGWTGRVDEAIAKSEAEIAEASGG